MKKDEIETKIALINPPYRAEKSVIFPNYPLGIGYLQASCKRNGIECDVYDFSQTVLSDEELIKKYELYQYKIIGITSFSIDFERTVEFINEIKKNDIIVVVGGHHASQLGGKLIEEFMDIDYSIKGYGEEAFVQLVKCITVNNKDGFSGISGLCYRRNGVVFENEIDYSNLNLDTLSFPERDSIVFDYDKQVCLEDNTDTLTISSSRGCPYTCTFCVNCKNSFWMSRSVENVMDEIRSNLKKRTYQYISFVDCNFFVDCDRAMKILKLIHDEYEDITISFQLRADQICHNEEYIKEISNYKLLVEVGIESNSLSVLKRYNKMTTPEINQRAIDILKQNGINYAAYMIMFEALENVQDVRANFDFIKENKIYTYQNIGNLYQAMFPFYGSRYYEEYGQHYKGSIHHRTLPMFQDVVVGELYAAVYNFRNRHEDRVNEILYYLHNIKDICESLQISEKIILYHYGIFEYLLIMCEKFGVCDVNILYSSKIYKEFTEWLQRGEKYE